MMTDKCTIYKCIKNDRCTQSVNFRPAARRARQGTHIVVVATDGASLLACSFTLHRQCSCLSKSGCGPEGALYAHSSAPGLASKRARVDFTKACQSARSLIVRCCDLNA